LAKSPPIITSGFRVVLLLPSCARRDRFTREGRSGEWNRSAPPSPTKLRHSPLVTWFVYPGKCRRRSRASQRVLSASQNLPCSTRDRKALRHRTTFRAPFGTLSFDPSKRLCRHGVGRQQHSALCCEELRFSSATCDQVINTPYAQ
jgi:hypothetical protein